MGVMSDDLTKLTAENLSPNLIGRKVYLMTDDIEYLYGVKIGATHNTTNDMSDLTAFTIMDVDASNNSVILYCEETGGYLIVDEDANVDFTGTSRNAIRVWSDGSLDANHPTNGYSYEIKYDPWDGKGIYMSNMPTNDPHVYMYLIPVAGHSYSEPEFVWTQADNDDGYSATAIFTCSVCMKSVEVEAWVSRDGDFCYAEAEFNGKYYNAELQVGNGNYEIVGNVRLVTLDMFPENSDNAPTAEDFDGFVEFDGEYLMTWNLDIEGTIVVICGFGDQGVYMCSFADGVCNTEPTYSEMSITQLRMMLSAETTPLYYTVSGSGSNTSGGPAEIIPIEGLTAITADMLSGDMIDPSAHPSANLFEGFVEANWSSVSNMQFDIEDWVYVIFAFDEEGFYMCSFENGLCIDTEPKHDVDATIEDLLGWINNGNRFYYTVGATSDNPIGGQVEIIPIEGLTAITADMLSGSQIDSTAHPSANLFDGFVEANWSSVSNMQFDDEGTFYIIYAIDSEGFYVGSFGDGVCINENAEPYHDVDTTIAKLLQMINEGLRFYYISD